MEQIKIGKFLKTLRLEKGLTQEQLAERLQVSARTVSRCETGSNLPDISVLVELAEFYGVGIPEIIYAEREREIMTEETKKAAQTLGEYAEMTTKRLRKRICLLTALGLLCFTIYLLLKAMGLSEASHVGDFLSGAPPASAGGGARFVCTLLRFYKAEILRSLEGQAAGNALGQQRILLRVDGKFYIIPVTLQKGHIVAQNRLPLLHALLDQGSAGGDLRRNRLRLRRLLLFLSARQRGDQKRHADDHAADDQNCEHDQKPASHYIHFISPFLSKISANSSNVTKV